MTLALLTFFVKSSTPMSSYPLIASIISTANLALFFSSNGGAEDRQYLCSLIISAFLIRCLSIAAFSSKSSRLISSSSSVFTPLSVASSTEYPNHLAIFLISSILFSFSILNSSIFNAITVTWVVKLLNWANI